MVDLREVELERTSEGKQKKARAQPRATLLESISDVESSLLRLWKAQCVALDYAGVGG
jgi:hypothetical protein